MTFSDFSESLILSWSITKYFGSMVLSNSLGRIRARGSHLEDDTDVEADGELVVELRGGAGRLDVGVKFHQRRWQRRLADRVRQQALVQ